MTASIQNAQIVVPCSQFDATFAALTEQLGFRVDVIFPADAPTTAVVSGFGVTLRLETSAIERIASPMVLRLTTDRPPMTVIAPDLCIDWVCSGNPVEIPEGGQVFSITRVGDVDAWITGRAGMRYRDLIPGRYGGRFIASHICIPEGGPVPDYVHFHKIRFQMIFCKAGWVRVVYEDQGEPFVMHAGDCVLQPPEIRHRVLEASAGLEVIELGCPAIHETQADHALLLPNLQISPMREFGGQRFVRHVAADARWIPWTWMGHDTSGFEMRNSGISAATNAIAHVQVVRAGITGGVTPIASYDGELLFLFVLSGEVKLHSAALGEHTMQANDCATIPAGTDVSLSTTAQTEFLYVAFPGS